MTMNIMLWVVQIALAVESFAGGAYKIFNFDEIANLPAVGALSRGGWSAIGALEMLCGALLIVPAVAKRMRVVTPAAAIVLALESLALAGLYARYSLAMTATNPLPYVVAAGLMAVFVAYGRYAVTQPA
jgi:hypothetical protein